LLQLQQKSFIINSVLAIVISLNLGRSEIKWYLKKLLPMRN